LMNPADKLTIFFTLNGILIGSVLIFPLICLLEFITYYFALIITNF
jgi:hypothetical protein